jgi:hypothetical protein
MSPVFVLRHAGMPFEWLAELGLSAECVALADAADRDPALLPRWEQGYAEERDRLRAVLHRQAGQVEFRGAVFLSNPGMYEGMLRGYLDRGRVPDNARFRRVERQVYRYLQRFCGKNETTSTFGPMGYGEIDDGVGLRVERRPQRRLVLLARWALEELAKAVARDPALRRHIPLHRSLLVANLDHALGVDPSRAQRTMWESLASGPMSIGALSHLMDITVKQASEQLRPLLAAGAVHRGLVFRAEVVDGLAELRAAVAALPPAPARASWLAELDGFAQGCDAFAGADIAARQCLLTTLEQKYTELAGLEARRGSGDIYADRLILFEEASSPFHLRIGADLAQTIEDELAAALDLSAETGARVQREYQEEMAAILAETGNTMGFTAYAGAARPQRGLRSEFGGHRHNLTVDVAAGQDVDLPAPGDIDSPQRYALPDICLVAPDPQALSAQPQVVLARAHHHLLLEGWLTTFADDRDRINDQVRAWLTGSVPGRMLAALATTRRNKGFYRFPGQRVIITPVDHEGGKDVVAGSELTVELVAGTLRLSDGQGRRLLLYPMLADLATYPPIAALTDVPVLHMPVRQTDPTRPLGRVRVGGGAVYQRASWSVDLTELASLRGAAAFRALRRQAVTSGLPRFVFVRSEAERKPLLIDTWSPFAVDMLGHLAARASHCRAEEMLPGPEELWLSDERGHYTCELRVQFLRDVDVREERR